MSPVAIFLLSLIILPLQTARSAGDDDNPKETLKSNERDALLTFINGVDHDPTKLTWDKFKRACYDWKGVICDPEKTTVLYIRLPAISLLGKIPDNSLGKLPSLRVLSIHDNALSDKLPPDFAELTSLTRLYIHKNQFSGQLPYIEADNLIKLDVSVNKLVSSIPHPFSKFSLSSFDNNDYLCGPPTKNVCNDTFNPPPDWVKPKKHRIDVRLIVWITVASGIVLFILLLIIRKMMYSETKRRRPLLVEVNNLVFLEDGFGFKLDDLLNASAEVLGEGSVGTSYKQTVVGKEMVIGELGSVGTSKKRVEEKKRMVVVKRLRDVKVKELEFRDTMEVFRKVKSINLVPLVAYYYSEYEKWLVYDYMPGGSLSDRLHGSRQTRLNWDQRMRIAMSAAKGLAYLHEAGVVHGNIKSSNILLRQETNEASLSDYGLNTLFGEPGSLNRHVTGYWAPEAFKTRKVTFKSDVYSFGVLLLELLTGKTVKQASLGEEGVHFSNLVESVIWDEPKLEIFDVELGRDRNFEMLQLLQIAKDCVLIVPENRPTMHDVVRRMDDMWLRPSFDDHSRGYDETPSTDTRDTPSTSIFTP
ncbi:putative inactive receptor kinase At2g26730 isoform X2 [Bidens hawaiensis]|uniref:putative inactive receptor kinase At2g26730 isoform X2 n=1 Tax=Bidens hawaiensis TaxID=980011 RepID=UPI00404906BF